MQALSKTTDQLLKDLDNGWSLPAEWYTSSEIVDLEKKHIFRKTWQYVACTDELSNVGDFITGVIGDVPVVVVRNNDGLAGFVNVCRHRRHEVASGCGNSKMLQCPYHAWTYDLHGQLKAAPRSNREEDFCLEELPLLPVKVETWGPFVFVNCDHDAKPLMFFLGELPEIIAGCGLDINTLKSYQRTKWNSDSNWKIMLENFLECYHCPVAHPGFSAVIDVDPDTYTLKAFDWFMSQWAPGRSVTPEQAKKAGYDPRGAITQSQYHLIWPNITISINPGHANLSIDVWNPDGHDKAHGISEQFFGPNVPDEWAQELIAFNKVVGEEDDALTNSVQRGLKSAVVDRGRFLTNSEHLVIYFQKLVVKSLAQT